MKKIFLSILLLAGLGICSCNKLDLNPLSQGSTGNFYSNQVELEMAVNELYQAMFWGNDNELFSDNVWDRASGGNIVISGTMGSSDATANLLWTNCYKGIARANTFLASKSQAAGSTPASVLLKLEAEVRLIRAYEYGRLVTHFGNVPLIAEPLKLEESYSILQTDKEKVLDFVFKELDFAAANLPASYTGSDLKRLTKGAAWAIKARIALHSAKWQVAKEAASEVMKLAPTVYSLHPSYSQLFLTAGESSKEIILSLPRDQTKASIPGLNSVTNIIGRNAGGFGAYIPTRSMVDAYECIDGLPIDESPLYSPSNPFKNRDPRLSASIVPFSTQWLGYSYQPHPDSLQVWSSKENRFVSNKDNRAVAIFASYTGFLIKKGVDQSWADKLTEDNDIILYRYAEILLTYAEAKIELNELDASVMDAINQVRARGYGVSAQQTSQYPAVKLASQNVLRGTIKRERRVEFVLEGMRYMDLIRWKLAEKALTRPVIGLPDPAAQDRSKWPFPGIPSIDEDGIPDYSSMIANVKILGTRNFDKNRQYLWPIPSFERIVNPGLIQNPNY